MIKILNDYLIRPSISLNFGLIKNELMLWKIFGISLVYVNIIFMYYNEFLFLEPIFDVKLIYNYTILFICQSAILSWMIGYTPLSICLTLSYFFFNLIIVYTKIVFNLGWDALAQTGISAYWFYFVIAHIFGTIVYKLTKGE